MSRSHHLAAVVLALTVGLAAVPTTFGGSADRTHGKVRIRLTGSPTKAGPECARGIQGHFRLSGALSDRGWFSTTLLVCHAADPFVTVLYGTKGSIRITSDWPHWSVTGGSDGYAGLRGRGTVSGWHSGIVNLTMIGTVVG